MISYLNAQDQERDLFHESLQYENYSHYCRI
jgi:hypothetical protein